MSTQPQQAAATSGNPQADAKGAMKGGEAQRGAPEQAPRDLGRKDPATNGETAPDKDGVPIR